ncbi:MAG: Fic family protein [Gammaproteobacteria bacterium]|nr:Fic family protein [Gammaproteobacteria bacterium]MCW8991983.1 Fic family protein [Gammaproteobacteria bacterium]
MKIPLTPPRHEELLIQLDASQISQLFGIPATQDGRYLHWDEMRHRTPPEGVSHELWWAGAKIARRGMSKELPLLDKHDRPITFTMPDPVLLSLHEIDRQAAGEIAMAEQAVSGDDRNRYLVSSLIEEAITSSQLEGATTTREEAKDMLRSGRTPRDRSERMILNNYHVMEQIRSLKDESLTPKRVLELHRIVTHDTLDDPSAAGRFRRPDERISVMDATHTTTLHTPPAAQSLERRLERLCDFANQDEKATPFVHPVIRAILIHFMLGYDHPFVDGNGRTARALFYWSMARSGYWLMEYLSISRLIKKAPAKYARAYLYTETDDNDATYFILHQLAVIEQAIQALHDYLARKIDEQRSAESLLRKSPSLSDNLNHRQMALLSHALRHAGHGYTVASHKRSHKITTQTSRTDLQKLAELGLLEQRKRGRAFVFYAPSDLVDRIETASRAP